MRAVLATVTALATNSAQAGMDYSDRCIVASQATLAATVSAHLSRDRALGIEQTIWAMQEMPVQVRDYALGLMQELIIEEDRDAILSRSVALATAVHIECLKWERQ